MSFLLVFSAFLAQCLGARILVITPTPFYSHQIAFQPLFQELALRGHDVTLFTAYPSDDNFPIKQVNLSEIRQILEKDNILEQISTGNVSTWDLRNKIYDVVKEMVEYTMCHPELRKIVNSGTKYDLVIMEYLMTAPAAFGHILNCPIMGVVSLDAPNNIHNTVGNPGHPVANPDFNLGYSINLSFKERLFSTLSWIIQFFIFKFPVVQFQDQIIRKCLGSDLPSLEVIQNNISLLLINANPIFNNVRPLGPTTINVGGGMHLTKPQPLPQELQDLLDGATNGAIYFSLGSSMKSAHINPTTRQIIMETFSELPFIVLWKFENVDLEKKPKNVYINKWFPQQDVLRHPNVKLFITQGGLQSLEEAIYNYVPIVGMPFFGDQFNNIDRIVKRGLGLLVDHRNITKDFFKETIIEAIQNPKYKANIKKIADATRDQPMTALEKAVWWTEYVIRHKGTELFRNPVVDLPLYQFYLLDVLLFLLTVIATTLFIIITACKLSFKASKRVFSKLTKPKLKVA